MVILGLLLMASLEVCGQATNQQGGSGGPTPVAALPGTCTALSTPVQLTVQPYGTYYPVLSNGTCKWQGGPNPGSNVFNVKNYGAYGDTQAQLSGCTWATQNNISCTGYSFTSADIGKNVQQFFGIGTQNEATISTVSGGNVTGVTNASY